MCSRPDREIQKILSHSNKANKKLPTTSIEKMWSIFLTCWFHLRFTDKQKANHCFSYLLVIYHLFRMVCSCSLPGLSFLFLSLIPLFALREDPIMNLWLAWNSLYRTEWCLNCDLSASASWKLGLQVCATWLALCCLRCSSSLPGNHCS